MHGVGTDGGAGLPLALNICGRTDNGTCCKGGLGLGGPSAGEPTGVCGIAGAQASAGAGARGGAAGEGRRYSTQQEATWGLLLTCEVGTLLHDGGVQGVGRDGLGVSLVLGEEPGLEGPADAGD